MTERGKQLHAAADEQIAQLISVVSTLNEAALRRPCSGREKLGEWDRRRVTAAHR